MKTFYKIFFILIFGSQLHAQQELMVPLMSHLSSVSKVNPAYMPKTAWTLRIPSLAIGLLHTGPNFNDLYTREASGKFHLNGDQALSEFSKTNVFEGAFSGDILGADFAWEDNLVGFQYGTYVDAAINYTADGARLLLKGNGETIGETLTVGPALKFNVYDKIGLRYARQVNKFSVGGRINFLFGRKALVTEQSDVTLLTESDYYALDLTTNYVVHSSDFVDIDTSTNDVSFSSMGYTPGLGRNGSGVGFDLGLGYEFSDEINGFLSVTDIGSIRWKKNVSTYSSTKHSRYDGIKIKSLVNLDTASLAGMLDSIQKFIGLEKSSGEFKTKLTPSFMAGGTWKFTDKLTIDGVLMFKRVLNKNMPAAGIGIQYQSNEWFMIGSSVSYQNKRINHIGLNTTFEFYPLQMFMGTDNILTFLAPKSANTTHFRLGVNVMFGKYKKRKTIYGLG